MGEFLWHVIHGSAITAAVLSAWSHDLRATIMIAIATVLLGALKDDLV